MHLVALLHAAARGASEEVARRLDEEGFADIRPVHGCVFGNIAPGGSRLTDLAELSGLTKQAVGEVASELAQRGYLERVPDPRDGRAKILTLTERGQRAQRVGFRLLAQIEADWAERYGGEDTAALRRVLEAAVLGREPAAA
jgi:DNA-binding MarR family transcriptional regulator